MTNHQWRLAARPSGTVKESDFQWTEAAVAEPADGEILVRNIYLSLDPTHRVWMNAADSYLPAMKLGEVMRGGTIGVVERSNHPAHQPGDVVNTFGGWQEYWTGPASAASRIPRVAGLPLTAWYGALGHIGFTSYFGLFDVGRPKPGETVVVTAAAGAVGSLAGQMAKIAGCRVVGIAGSDDKCAWITRVLGFDAAINYRTENVREELARHCPNGIDVAFENVGGDIMEAVIERLNVHSRIALCGMISQYNSAMPWGPRNFGLFISKRVTCTGFLVMDYAARFPEAVEKILGWLSSGQLQYRVDVVDGLRSAPAALTRLFDGSNAGKLVVQLGAEPS